MWIVGHCETLANDKHWDFLIKDAKNRGRLFTQEQHKISVDGNFLLLINRFRRLLIPLSAKIAVTQAIETVENPKASGRRRPLFEDAPWQVILSNRAVSLFYFISFAFFFFFLKFVSATPYAKL